MTLNERYTQLVHDTMHEVKCFSDEIHPETSLSEGLFILRNELEEILKKHLRRDIDTNDQAHVALTREQLAAFTHEVWANWMKHFIPKYVNGTIKNSDIERWARQRVTPYEELSEKEKESDRKVAQKVLDKIL